jgi:bifunctional DNA-binding transcriptional regulator/antitoxin component of YhaV-PrlF toxin-antitoxin module
MTTVLSADGLIEIPEAFRKADALKPGQRCDIERVGEGEYRVSVQVADDLPKERLIDVLRSCPVKDWWVEPDRSERTTLEPSTLFAE